MKIGLSYSRCLRDIVEGKVPYDEVLIIIARTSFDPRNDDEWHGIWTGYTNRHSLWTNPEWYGCTNEDEFRAMSIMLWEDGKLHQPRLFGASAVRRHEYWLETILPDSELERNPAAKKAWEKFQTVAKLSGIHNDDEYR